MAHRCLKRCSINITHPQGNATQNRSETSRHTRWDGDGTALESGSSVGEEVEGRGPWCPGDANWCGHCENSMEASQKLKAELSGARRWLSSLSLQLSISAQISIAGQELKPHVN